MSKNEDSLLTQHAMLVVWGQFAQAFGLIQGVMEVPIGQKTVEYSPHTKILEFFIAILAGLKHLQDLNAAAEPIVKDEAVARAWLQPGWAHHSGVSRTLTAMTQAEAEQITQVLEKLEQPIINREVMLALASQDRLMFDGDLTARPVSDTSTDYPGAAFGHMGGDTLGKGFQSSQVSVRTPTYGRLLLSSALNPGDVVSSSQTEALVQAAEKRIGMHPLRRTDLVEQRLEKQKKHRQDQEERLGESQNNLEHIIERIVETDQAIAQHPAQLAAMEAEYQAAGKKERPFSALGRLRKQSAILQKRRTRLEKQLARLQHKMQLCQTRWAESLQTEKALEQRLEQLRHENSVNPFPIQAVFRLDAGFGTRENVIWLIEMGYEVYTRPCGNWLMPRLKKLAQDLTWLRVGKNAEMVAWKQMQPEDFPYPLDVALERFHTGDKLRHSTLLHCGADPVTTDLPSWFSFYNARQTIEAGIKEGKGTFAMRYLKVRSKPALYLQEQFGRFVANFVRFASAWLAEQCPELPNGWEVPAKPKVKQQVVAGAHTSAWIEWHEQGYLLRFTDHSVFAGRSLQLLGKPIAIQLALPFAEKLQI